MKRNILLLALLLSANSASAQTQAIVFPKAEDVNNKQQCITVSKPCSFNEGSMCTKKYCGVYINQLALDKFIKQSSIVGRKFSTIFELERYLRANLPTSLQDMSLEFVHRKSTSLKNFNPNRITVILDSKQYVVGLSVG